MSSSLHGPNTRFNGKGQTPHIANGDRTSAIPIIVKLNELRIGTIQAIFRVDFGDLLDTGRALPEFNLGIDGHAFRLEIHLDTARVIERKVAQSTSLNRMVSIARGGVKGIGRASAGAATTKGIVVASVSVGVVRIATTTSAATPVISIKDGGRSSIAIRRVAMKDGRSSTHAIATYPIHLSLQRKLHGTIVLDVHSTGRLVRIVGIGKLSLKGMTIAIFTVDPHRTRRMIGTFPYFDG